MGSDHTRSASTVLAERLIEATESYQSMGPVEPDLVPASVEHAEQVSDLVASITGWEVAGWKIGATSEQSQKVLGASEPFAGRVYSLFLGDTAIGDERLWSDPKLEGEFAFTLSQDIPAGAGPLSRSEIISRVGLVHPAIEVVGGRFADMSGTNINCLIADAGANCHLILGSGVDPSTQSLDELPTVQAALTTNGEVVGQGDGTHVLGDPINALGWLVEHLARRGIDLKAGQVVTTGSATQMSPFPAGSTSVATLDGIGSVSLTRSS